MDIYEKNKHIISAMKKRGFIELKNQAKVEKIDGHHYFENNPLSISKSKRFNTPELIVGLKVYNKKHDVFIKYAAKYTFIPAKNDFIERHAISYDYLHILKTIRYILEEANILSQLKNEIS